MARYFLLFLSFFSLSFCSLGEPSKIIFSNEPENIYKDGSLIDLQVTGSYRLFFSHSNRSGEKGDVFIKITSSEDNKVQYRSSFAGPNKSELYVGKILGERFLTNYNEVKESSLPLDWAVKFPNQTVLSGMIDIFPRNENVMSRVQVYFNSVSSIVFDEAKYVFPNKTLTKRLKISNNDVRYNLKIGDEVDYINNGNCSLVGNYGIFYEYYLEFSEIGEYQLLFTANGGPASCVFMLDGAMFSIYSNDSKKIGNFKVQRPGLKKLITFPLPGSNYPSTVTIVKERVYTK